MDQVANRKGRNQDAKHVVLPGREGTHVLDLDYSSSPSAASRINKEQHRSLEVPHRCINVAQSVLNSSLDSIQLLLNIRSGTIARGIAVCAMHHVRGS